MRASVLVFSVALAAVGCSWLEPDQSRLIVGVQGNTQALRPALSVTATGTHFSRTWRGADITSAPAPNYAAAVATPRNGRLTIRADLAAAGSAPTSAQVQLDVRPDWVWQVDLWLSDRNPLLDCMGCMGAKAFPVLPTLQRSARDSLYIVWGGNSIKHPVVY